MKAVSAKEIKQELNNRSQTELLNLCLRLSRFKKENKELLTYLLFESSDEEYYIKSVKDGIDEQFEKVNKKSAYFIRKSLRTILKNTKKYIRYSQKKETEVELLIYFCEKMKNFSPSIHHNRRIENIFIRLIETIDKKILFLHEDLQFDYKIELDELTE